jgi:hypothetical protein
MGFIDEVRRDSKFLSDLTEGGIFFASFHYSKSEALRGSAARENARYGFSKGLLAGLAQESSLEDFQGNIAITHGLVPNLDPSMIVDHLRRRGTARADLEV